MEQKVQMLRGRLRRNLARLRPWAARRGVCAYRLYDRDIPEVALCIDWYDGDVLVSEYAGRAPRGEAEQAAFAAAVRGLVLELTGAASVRWRRRERGAPQYERLDTAREERLIREGGHRFWVNLSDYLDTGLFLDHRDARALIGGMAKGKRLLNLFAYTGSFTVYAARGGATGSDSVDLSRTYLDWAARNLADNGIDLARHRLVRADALRFLDEQSRLPERRRPRYDLIVLDPPTSSRSKRMAGTLDIQRDHPRLLRQALTLLAPSGTLLFSSNCRTLSLRAEEVPGAVFSDVSEQTLPFDFHDRRVRSCYLVTRRP